MPPTPPSAAPVPASPDPQRLSGASVPPTLMVMAGGSVWLLLAAAALGRGGVAGWAEGLVLLAGAIGFAALAIKRPALPAALRAAAGLWLALAGWCWLQSLPLAGSFLSDLTHPLWAEAAAVIPVAGGGSIALDPYAARSDALRLAAYAGLFALGLVLAREGRGRALMAAILLAGTLYCAAAMLLVPAQPSASLGKVRHAADAVFPFTSRNTFCAFAGAGLIVSLSLLASARRETRLLWLAAAAVCGAGVLASHSRAGLAATAAGLVVALVILHPGRRAALLALLLAAVLAAVAFLMTLTGQRLPGLPADFALRLAVWHASAEFAASHFWLGLGSLDQALQMAPGDWGGRHIMRAHNIYLQAIAERGFPATLAGLAAVLIAAVHALRGRCRQPEPAARALPAAALGVLALFAGHGLVDFSLYAPVNAAVLAMLLGAACGSARPALPTAPPSATNARLSEF